MKSFFNRLQSLNPQLLFELLNLLEEQNLIFKRIKEELSSNFPKELDYYLEISDKILSSIEIENLQVRLKFYDSNKVVENKVNLNHDFTYTKPEGYRIYRGEIKKISSFKNLYIEMCKFFYSTDPQIFINFINKTDFNGQKRPYFSKTKEKMVKPILIGNQVYIETRFSSNKIRNLLIKIFKAYNLNYNILEIFIKQDRKDQYGYYENR